MSSSLFPEADTPVNAEPVVWIQRLVILERIEPDAVILRDIEFKLGLNVVCAGPPPPDTKEATGHDIGKTLLTRLLRYCLGEDHFAEQQTRRAISAVLPDSYVAVECRIGGVDWAIIRALGAALSQSPRAARAASWRELLGQSGDADQLETLVSQLDTASLSTVIAPALTHSRRPPQWLDVLAWIARDQHCRYADPLIWRDRAVQSGNAPLHQADASIVLRSVSGLINDKERQLFESHDEMLRERAKLDDDRKHVNDRFKLEEEMLLADLRKATGDDSDMVNEIGAEVLAQKVAGLRRLRADEAARRNQGALRRGFDDAVARRAGVAAERHQCQARLSVVEAELRHLDSPGTINVNQWLADQCDLPADDCPLKQKMMNQAVPNPYKLDHQRTLQEELAKLRDRIAALDTQLPDADQAVTSSRARLDAIEGELSVVLTGIDGQIAVLEVLRNRVIMQLQRRQDIDSTSRRVQSLADRIEESGREQRAIRDSLENARSWLADRYESICQTLVGSSRRYAVEIEAKAVRLNTVSVAGAPGEAISTAALVLGLDLACLRSALDGHGHHPRLLILDSPREGDMEIAIFERLIDLMLCWEAEHSDPRFQIIVTTTTRPSERQLENGVLRAELLRDPETKLLLARKF
jgi:hypothetical protein